MQRRTKNTAAARNGGCAATAPAAEQTEPPVEAITVPLWPTAGQLLGLRRGQTYAAAADGSIPTIRFRRLIRVSKGWLDKVARGEI